ncbi:dolichyl-P-Man:Man(5)GlcNAc(2)-PP-dolichol alpha-1,3-mannosyltransferase [Tilletia horrida]|nr:dolichyl-P-Man:Man(5)GlcNAc(2)-PP-dolichol alpha-1,3-mannosyltransferase [Tilletia horrida]
MSSSTVARSNGHSTSTSSSKKLQQRQEQQRSGAVPALTTLVRDVLTSQRLFWLTAAGVLLGEVALTALIIKKVPYTEIDYATYIQQADVFLRGERDYFKITGDTGPCVYPAGHLYIYSLFHIFSSGTTNIPAAQLAFGLLYLLNLAVVISLYHLAGAPTALLPFLAISKRLHSIYALRLFNDPFAMFFFYISVLLLCRKKWTSAVILFSTALSIKMNILLFMPALATILFRAVGLPRALPLAAAFFAVQILLSLPFTLPSPSTRAHYLSQAFDLSRVFLYKWTVNWRMVPESAFLSKGFARVLLGAHVSLLGLFGAWRWTGIGFLGWSWLRLHWNGPVGVIAPAAVQHKTPDEKKKLEATFAPTADYILSALFSANLIGIICSRSLHYQFYSWYAHQIPFLLWRTELPIHLKVILPLTIELAWNTFPSTTFSSTLLLASHLILLYGLWRAHAGDALEDEAALRAKAGFRPAVLSSRSSLPASASSSSGSGVSLPASPSAYSHDTWAGLF